MSCNPVYLVSIGLGGDTETINDAIVLARQYKKTNGYCRVTFHLLPGFVMAEQVFVRQEDLSYITIQSQDPYVQVDRTRISTSPIPLEDNQPIFFGENQAKLPIMGCVFDYMDNNTAYDGITCVGGSSVQFLASSSTSDVPVSGVRNARRGLTLISYSCAFCYIEGFTQGLDGLSVGPTFENCSNRALQAQHGSRFTLPKSNFDRCLGDYAVYVIWGSQGNMRRSTATGHRGEEQAAVCCRDGSVLCAREVDVSDAKNRGFHALHAAVLDARLGIANYCGRYGVLSSATSKIDFTGGSAEGCKYGVHASDVSIVQCTGANVTGSSIVGVSAYRAATINAESVDASGSNTGFSVGKGSTINAFGATGNTNITINKVTPSGIIYK